MKGMVIGLIFTLIAISFTGCTQEKEIRVAAQNVNETIILAHMAKILLEENLGLKITLNTDFTGSSVLHQAMMGDELDIYPTWTGTQLTGILRYEGPNLSPEDTYKKVKEGFEEKFDMTWSEPFGFNNTYVFTVRKDTADKYHLKKASDLAPYAKDWALAGDENFDTRQDAYPGWSKAYGIKFKEVLPMQYGLVYRAIENEEVDVAVAYATDSRIKKFDLTMLEDNKQFFPDYSGAYVLSQKMLKDYPKVLDTLNMLGGEIDTEQMGALNLRYDNGDDPEMIARDFLKDKGWIE